ncbi:hypothetical protein [Afipia felis]
MPVVFVALSLTAAIVVLLASLLILTRPDGGNAKLPRRTELTAPKALPLQPLWKMKNAPTAIKAKPTA